MANQGVAYIVCWPERHVFENWAIDGNLEVLDRDGWSMRAGICGILGEAAIELLASHYDLQCETQLLHLPTRSWDGSGRWPKYMNPCHLCVRSSWSSRYLFWGFCLFVFVFYPDVGWLIISHYNFFGKAIKMSQVSKIAIAEYLKDMDNNFLLFMYFKGKVTERDNERERDKKRANWTSLKLGVRRFIWSPTWISWGPNTWSQTHEQGVGTARTWPLWDANIIGGTFTSHNIMQIPGQQFSTPKFTIGKCNSTSQR